MKINQLMNPGCHVNSCVIAACIDASELARPVMPCMVGGPDLKTNLVFHVMVIQNT